MKTVLQCLKTRPRVHTLTSAKSLNNDSIIKSYGNPSTCNKESLQSSYRGEHKMKLLVTYETTSKLFFRSIHWAIPISVTNSPRVRSKITPYDTHQSTLMSPRYSNVTTSIRGWIIRYASNNFWFIIFNPTQRTSRASRDFYRRKDYENVHQPLCIDYPNVTSGIRELSAKTYIKWINRTPHCHHRYPLIRPFCITFSYCYL